MPPHTRQGDPWHCNRIREETWTLVNFGIYFGLKGLHSAMVIVTLIFRSWDILKLCIMSGTPFSLDIGLSVGALQGLLCPRHGISPNIPHQLISMPITDIFYIAAFMWFLPLLTVSATIMSQLIQIFYSGYFLSFTILCTGKWLSITCVQEGVTHYPKGGGIKHTISFSN